MKQLLSLSAISMLSVLLLSANCQKKSVVKSPCDDVACTMLFAMINVDVTDSTGNSIKADDIYTVRLDNNDTIRSSQTTLSDKTLTIIDDGYVLKMRNSQHDFKFICIKNSKVVVNEPYTLGADCCHVNKISGKDAVIAKL